MARRFPKRLWTGPYVGWGALDGNHHGPRIEGPADSYDHETLRSTWQIVTLDNGLNPPPRYFWGKRLWVYAASGRCWHVDICWRSSHRYALSEIERERRAELYVAQEKAAGAWPPKGGMCADVLGAYLGSVGLGLKITERDA